MRAALVLAACLLAGCSTGPVPASPGASGSASTSPPAPSPTVASTPGATTDRIEGWRADIDALVPGMDRLHPQLDHGTPLSELNAAAADLRARVPDLTDDELLVGILRIVAMVSAAGCDAHTGAYVWGEGSYPVTSLPLRLWVFEDGVRVVDVLGPDRDLVGARIDAIGGHPIDDVVRAVDPIIPRDNSQTVALLLPRFLLMPEILRGLGLTGGGPVEVEVTLPEGGTETRVLEPIAMAEYNDWAGPYGLHVPSDPAVPWLSRIDDLLWWDELDGGEALFIQYNRVERLPSADLDALRTAIAGPAVEQVILDLRHNYGGEVSALGPLRSLFHEPALDQPGRVFILTGRNTYSAGSLLVAWLEDTNATVVGEPMGGCPTSYGDPDPIQLPYSGIQVNVSTLLEIGAAADDARLTIPPDLPAVLTFEAWQSGTDPALDAVRFERVPAG